MEMFSWVLRGFGVWNLLFLGGHISDLEIKMLFCRNVVIEKNLLVLYEEKDLTKIVENAHLGGKSRFFFSWSRMLLRCKMYLVNLEKTSKQALRLCCLGIQSGLYFE